MPDRRQEARPLGQRVLVKVIDEQEGTMQQTEFGAFLAWSLRQQADQQAMPQEPRRRPKPARGFITHVGPGALWVQQSDDDGGPGKKHYVPMELRKGDEVLFYSEVGVPVEVEGEELLLVAEQAILVVLSSMVGEPAMYQDIED